LCEDRFWFAVGLLGSWEAGLQISLPPHRGPAALGALRERHLTLHDGGLASDARSLDVRSVGEGGPGPLGELAAERPLLTLYTSGSSGEPQAWTKRSRQLLGEAQVLAQVLRVVPGDRVLPTVAPQHIYGLLFGVLMPLAAGASFARETPLHGEAILHCAAALGARLVISVPAHLAVVARLLTTASGDSVPGDPAAGDALSVEGRSFVSSGAPLSLELAAELRRAGAEVLDVLGSTETGGIALRRAGVEEAWAPLPGVSVQVDAEERLVVRSPFVDEANQLRATGDRGRLTADGRFVHLGRADDVVKVGGKRVSLGEVERAVRALPGVADAAALRAEVGGLRGEEVWLAVVAPRLDAQVVRAALRQRLDPVFVPRRVRVVPALPREANGKLPRARLLALFDSAAAAPVPPAPVPPAPVHRAEFDVPAQSPRFDGHFPGNPLLPAVAQLTDYVLPTVANLWPELGSLTRVNRLQFTAPVRPGDRLKLTLQRRGAKVLFELSGPHEPVARGTLVYESPEAAPRTGS
jgi:acyl-coenzyme A synthetase/AMP-(fatty) acid ligase